MPVLAKTSLGIATIARSPILTPEISASAIPDGYSFLKASAVSMFLRVNHALIISLWSLLSTTSSRGLLASSTLSASILEGIFRSIYALEEEYARDSELDGHAPWIALSPSKATALPISSASSKVPEDLSYILSREVPGVRGFTSPHDPVMKRDSS
jgi:hypothetical protein